jgi:hypothetical protein
LPLVRGRRRPYSTEKDGDFFPIDYRIYAPDADGKTKQAKVLY